MWTWNQPYRKPDIEAGGAGVKLFPMMMESPALRWAFIRRVYSILTFQLLLTIAIAALVVYVHPISRFFVSTGDGLALYIFLVIMPFMAIPALYFYHQKYPVNFLLLALFTIPLSFAVGLTCAFTSRKIIMESVILTALVLISLTLYTFWAARRGYDFNFLGPFIFGALLAILVYGIIQIFIPVGMITVTIYGALASIIFCAFIIYDTDNLIKRHSYDEYIWASVCLYLDIINLFLSLLTVFRAVES